MTTSASPLKLHGCLRCDGTIELCYDHLPGGYWRCLQCGDHSYVNVPKPPSLGVPGVVREYRVTFVYAGPEDAFQGHQIRGRLLPRESSITTEWFDITCPYQNCTRRQRKMGSHTREPTPARTGTSFT